MVNVVCDPDEVHTNLPPTLVAMVAYKLELRLESVELRAKKKWEEQITVDGMRMAVVCHKKDDEVIIKRIRPLKKQKGWPTNGKR